MVTGDGDQGSGTEFLVQWAFRGRGYGFVGTRRIQRPRRGAVGQGLGKLTSKTEM